MLRRRTVVGGWVFLLLGCTGLVGTSCDSSKVVTECEVGSERCGCYANGTCDEGLICRSERCVVPASGGMSASYAGGPAVSTGNGGAPQLGSGGAGAAAASSGAGASPLGLGGHGASPPDGAGSGGLAAGGMATSSTNSAGAASATTTGNFGGAATGGTATGGTATGGKPTGGTASGGSAAGGMASGGSAAGGTASGGSAAGGTAGAATGPNLVTDGDFSSSVNGLNGYWGITSVPEVTFVYGFIDGMFNIRPAVGQSWVLSWPKNVGDAATVELGARYQFSFRSRAVNGATIIAVIRSATDTTLQLTAITLTVTASWQQFSYDISMPTGLPGSMPPAVGVAFKATETTSSNNVFFDDVVLSKY